VPEIGSDPIGETCRQILEAAGVDKLIDEYGSYDIFNTTHVFGKCLPVSA